jgi:excisionase family DNA binding protein
VSKITKPPTPALALSIEEAANALGVGWDTFNAHVADELRIVRIGRRKLVPVVELERWLERNAERVS